MATYNYPEVYPHIVKEISCTLPFQHNESQAVLSTEFENGVEVRRLIQDAPRRGLRIAYSPIFFDDVNVLRRFYEQRSGSLLSFDFYYPFDGVIYVNEYVGTSITGSETTLNLPSWNATNYTLYKNGISLTYTVDWSFSAGTADPTKGYPITPDQATLVSAPAVGDVFHFDFTGNLKVKARFSDSPLGFSEMKGGAYEAGLSSLTVELKGLEHSLA